METSILTSKGQLLIPKRLRNKYGITSGVRVIFEETPEGVLVKPMNKTFFKQFSGILTGHGKLREEMKQLKEDEILLEEETSSTRTLKNKKK